MLTKAELDSKYGEGNYLAMLRFLHTHSSGEKRAIDDGDRYGHARGAGYTETLDLCTAIQPAIHARILVTAMDQECRSRPGNG